MTERKEHAIQFEGLEIPKDKYQPPVKKKPDSDEYYDLNDPEFPVVQDHEFRTKYWRIPHNSFSTYLRYLDEHWAYFNKTRFEGQLKKPRFGLLKDLDAQRMRLRGRYGPETRRPLDEAGMLEISPNLFNAPHEGWVNRTLIHEMCHQAVWQVEGPDAWDDEYKQGKGHGSRWMSWMRHAHLPPSRFDDTRNEMYMGPDDHKREQDRQELREKVKEVRKTRVPMQQPRIGLGVAIHFKNKEDLVIGILIGPMAAPRDENGNPKIQRKLVESWYFISISDKRVYKASLRHAYYLYPDESKVVDTPFWQQEVQRQRFALETRGLIDI
jgi:hypothetical protein